MQLPLTQANLLLAGLQLAIDAATVSGASHVDLDAAFAKLEAARDELAEEIAMRTGDKKGAA